MVRKPVLLVMLIALVAVSGCDMLDPARPSAQPDTEIFGNVMDNEELPDEPGVFTVRVSVNPPRALEEAEEAGGRPAPPEDDGVIAELRVDSDTVVLKRGMPATLADLDPGTEVVGIPVPGSTQMVGETLIMLDAEMLIDFETFRRWRMPLLLGDDLPPVEDVSKINTAGIEHAPIPVAGGRVLYFSARMRRTPDEEQGMTYVGAVREGLEPAEETKLAPEMSFRAEFVDGKWTTPELVRFPNGGDATMAKVTWVNADETSCLVTMRDASGGLPWVGRSERRSAKAAWGAVEPLQGVAEGASSDGVFLGGEQSQILVYVGAQAGGQQTDLFLFNPAEQDVAMPLEPRINTVNSEWGPRIGPDNELYFSRGDRQLVFVESMVQPVYLGLEHRVFFSELAPTDDGRWVFLTYTIPTAGDPDLDIWVAPRNEDGAIGAPMPIADWQP